MNATDEAFDEMGAAWAEAVAALPADEGNPFPNLVGGEKFAGWSLDLHRFPRPSEFPGDEGNQYQAVAMPAIDSHHRNAINARGATGPAALRALAAQLREHKT